MVMTVPNPAIPEDWFWSCSGPDGCPTEQAATMCRPCFALHCDGLPATQVAQLLAEREVWVEYRTDRYEMFQDWCNPAFRLDGVIEELAAVISLINGPDSNPVKQGLIDALSNCRQVREWLEQNVPA